jgi:putative membrane protein
MSSFLVAKALHIFLIVGWFAGLFYLPRIFVNLAESEHPVERERLVGMARRLWAFMQILGGGAVVAGLVTWYFFGMPMGGWIHIKITVVSLLIVYQIFCGRYIRHFEQGNMPHSSRWFRWFNEIPTLLLLVVIVATLWKF